jgi:phage terminase small subunit
MARRSANTKGRRGKGRRRLNATKVRRRRFVDGILAGKKGARSARDAGYSARRSAATASELLARPDVQAEIEKGLMPLSRAEGLVSLQAEGKFPTKETFEKGAPKREFDYHAAGRTVLQLHEKLKEVHKFELPGDRQEALEEIQKTLRLFGLEKSIEEIASTLEAAGA